MIKIYTAILAAISLAGCTTAQTPSAPAHIQYAGTPSSSNVPIQLSANQRNAVESGVRGAMKDPDSARFGSISASKSDKGVISVCGYVNGRNSFGGYTGEQPFIGVIIGQEPKLGFAVIDIASTETKVAAARSVCAQNNISI